MDFLFISLVTWSYRRTWQNPPQNPDEQHTDGPRGRKGADILGGGKQWQFGAMLLDTVGLKSTFSFPRCT